MKTGKLRVWAHRWFPQIRMTTETYGGGGTEMPEGTVRKLKGTSRGRKFSRFKKVGLSSESSERLRSGESEQLFGRSRGGGKKSGGSFSSWAGEALRAVPFQSSRAGPSRGGRSALPGGEGFPTLDGRGRSS